MLDPAVDIGHTPSFPDGKKFGVAIIGCGSIVNLAHLPAYKKYGVPVAGLYDIRSDAAQSTAARFDVPRVYASIEEILSDDSVSVVDIAVHAAHRAPLVAQAIEAGKHVLGQKPLTTSADETAEIIDLARAHGSTVAVNLNARWAPSFRVATLLIDSGCIGDVVHVTHIFEQRYSWTPGSAYDDMPHFVLFDYATHWIDITRCWLGDPQGATVAARDYRVVNQPRDSKTPWGAEMRLSYPGGPTATILSIGQTQAARHPFLIHGTEGTIRGSVLGSDYVELEQDGNTTRFGLDGAWFPDGFAGAMAELMSAIADGREPYNSAQHYLGTIRLTEAALESADANGEQVQVS